MATYTPAGAGPIYNRRHGVVFSTMKEQLTVRALAIPVQPKPQSTARATQAFSLAAAYWPPSPHGCRPNGTRPPLYPTPE